MAKKIKIASPVKIIRWLVEVSAYSDNFNGAYPGRRYPLVHLHGFNGPSNEYHEYLSLTVDPSSVEELCIALKAAAAKAQFEADADHEFSVEVQRTEPNDEHD